MKGLLKWVGCGASMGAVFSMYAHAPMLVTALSAGVAVGSLTAFVLDKETTLQQPLNERSAASLVRLRREAKVPFDPKNEEHEALLLRLWSVLKPSESLSDRISEDWGKIGFQGKDPATDFRGMGILGLRAMVCFSEANTEIARQFIENPDISENLKYPFAVCGINLTSDVLKFLETHGTFTNGLFSSVDNPEDFTAPFSIFAAVYNEYWILFHPFYNVAVHDFIRAGGLPQLAVMQFNIIRENFATTMERNVLRNNHL